MLQRMLLDMIKYLSALSLKGRERGRERDEADAAYYIDHGFIVSFVFDRSPRFSFILSQ